jgi:hypothetical protein
VFRSQWMAAVHRKSRRTLLLGTALGAAVGIIGVAAAQNENMGPATAPPGASEVSAVPDQLSSDRAADGPGLSADQAIELTLRSIGDASVTSARLIQAPTDASNPQGSDQWLEVTIDSEQGDDIEPVWLGQLVQGAVSDLMRTNESTTSSVLEGAQIVDQDGDGNNVVTPLGHGDVVGGQIFGSPDDAALLDRVDKAAAEFGLKVESARVLHPLDSAMAVHLTVPDGQVDWTLSQLTTALEGSRPTIEGIYVELDSPSGQPLLKASRALRIPGGGLWFADGQDIRFGATHG